MFTIHLNKLEFYAHHGIHEEERVIGTTFEVSVNVTLKSNERIDSIHQTVNYTDVFEIIARHMKRPVALLELLAENILEEIHAFDKRISKIDITIMKKNPPIRKLVGETGVSFSKEY